eukprot:gene2424-biopygen11230
MPELEDESTLNLPRPWSQEGADSSPPSIALRTLDGGDLSHIHNHFMFGLVNLNACADIPSAQSALLASIPTLSAAPASFYVAIVSITVITIRGIYPPPTCRATLELSQPSRAVGLESDEGNQRLAGDKAAEPPRFPPVQPDGEAAAVHVEREVEDVARRDDWRELLPTAGTWGPGHPHDGAGSEANTTQGEHGTGSTSAVGRKGGEMGEGGHGKASRAKDRRRAGLSARAAAVLLRRGAQAARTAGATEGM